MQQYIIDKFILSILFHTEDTQVLDQIMTDIEARQELLINTLVSGLIDEKNALPELKEKVKAILINKSMDDFSDEDKKLVESIISIDEIQNYIEQGINGFNKIIYDQAKEALSKEEKEELNLYIKMVEEQMNANRLQALSACEDELNKRSNVNLNLGGSLSQKPSISTQNVAAN